MAVCKGRYSGKKVFDRQKSEKKSIRYFVNSQILFFFFKYFLSNILRFHTCNCFYCYVHCHWRFFFFHFFLLIKKNFSNHSPCMYSFSFYPAFDIIYFKSKLFFWMNSMYQKLFVKDDLLFCYYIIISSMEVIQKVSWIFRCKF